MRAPGRRPLWRWALVAIYAGTIFMLSHQPHWIISLPDIRFADKMAHFVEFGLLASLMVFALGPLARSSHVLLLVAVAVATYGLLDEVHQAFVPGRFSDPFDVAADTAGACFVVALHFAWMRGRARKGGSM